MRTGALCLALVFCSGCTVQKTQLRQFEHFADSGARILYTVDMFKCGKNRLNGYWVSYYTDTEQKWTEGAHQDGKMHGVWTWWNKSGAITGQQHFAHGVVQEQRTSAPWWGYFRQERLVRR